MKQLLSGLLILAFLVSLALSGVEGCGGRLPSPKTAHKVIQKHFQKYGRKYKESDFGKHPVEKVEIFEVTEVQKDLAEALAYVALEGGSTVRRRVTLRKEPTGSR